MTDTNLFSKSLNDQVKYLWLLYKRVLDTPPGSSEWGSITGTLSDQTDLETALNGKQSDLATTAEVGINGAAEAGYGLKVTGNIKATSTVWGLSLTIGSGGAMNISEPGADTMLLTATTGVETSGRFTVGGGFRIMPSTYVDAMNYDILSTDYCITADGSSNSVDITGNSMDGGQICTIICTSVSNLVRVIADNATYEFLTIGSVVTIYKNPNNTNTYITSVFKV